MNPRTPRFVAWWLAVSLLLGLAACGADPREDYAARLAAAREELRSGSSERAFELFDALRRRYPDENEPLSYLAWAATRLGEPERAVPALEERVERGGPGVHVALDLLATVLEEADRWVEAEARYREALAVESDYAPSYLKLSRLLARSGGYAEALEVAAEGTERFPEDAALAAWHGNALLKSRRWEEAEAELRRAVDLPEAGAYPHYLLGLVYLGTERLEAARGELARAAELQPDVAEAWYQLAHAAEKLGDLEARDRALERFAAAFRRRFPASDGEPPG